MVRIRSFSHHPFCCIFSILALFSYVLFLAAPARALDYSYEIVAEVGDIIDGQTLTNIQNNPALNNDGDVAFLGDFSDAGPREGIFTRTNLLVQTGDIIDGETITDVIGTDRRMDLNDNDMVAFGANTVGSGIAIFTQNALIAKSGDVIDGETVQIGQGSPCIDNFDNVYFKATIGGASAILDQDSLIFLSQTTNDGDPNDIDVIAFSVPGCNDNNGTVVFQARYFGPGFLASGTGAISDQTPTPLVTAGIANNPFGWNSQAVGSPPLVNDNDVAAWRGTGSSPSGGGAATIYSSSEGVLGQSGVVVSGLTMTGPFSGEPISINNDGDVPISATFSLPQGGTAKGIFTQKGMVALEGQDINGRTMKQPFGWGAINDNGQVAFVTSLGPAMRVVILATPLSDPVDLVDHFLFYDVKKNSQGPRFFKFGPVTLEDQFRTANYNVLGPKRLGLPANKNDEGFTQSSSANGTHLAEYKIRPSANTPPFQPRRNVQIQNQCSDVTLKVTRLDSLLVPTNKSLSGAAAPVDETTLNVDHFLCYKAQVQKRDDTGANLPRFLRGTQVAVTDQFETDRRYDLMRITRLCNPVKKTGTPVFLNGPQRDDPKPLSPAPAFKHAEAHLVCYAAKIAKKTVPQDGCGPQLPIAGVTNILPKQPRHTKQLGVYLNNQFGPEIVNSLKAVELCIPSTKTLP